MQITNDHHLQPHLWCISQWKTVMHTDGDEPLYTFSYHSNF